MADIYNLVKAMHSAARFSELFKDLEWSGEYLVLQFSTSVFDKKSKVLLSKLLAEESVVYLQETRQGQMIRRNGKEGKASAFLITREDFLARADDWLEQLGDELDVIYEHRYGEPFDRSDEDGEYGWLKKKIAFFRDPSQWKPIEESVEQDEPKNRNGRTEHKRVNPAGTEPLGEIER